MKVNPVTDLTGKQAGSNAVGHSPMPENAKSTGKGESTRVEINLPRSNQHNDGQLTNEQEISKAIDNVSQMLADKHIDLNWNYDDKSNSIVIRFVERNSNKLIRQVPPEEILKLRQHITEMLGMIYDQKL
ncbi:MAG: hypothetical protein GF307_09600 [candidate division Zixibacteria bacterium]|nr:hypothetical protein [candidate division Zixibacteria bacterium]